MNAIHLIHDDVMHALGEMPDASVDLVITSPPIGIHVNDRARTTSIDYPEPEWLTEALRVSRGPVIWTVSPELFLAFPRPADPDVLLCWMIDAEKDYSPGRGFSSDWNLICVHRPGSIRASCSDVFLARRGLPTWTIKEPIDDEREKHPAPGSAHLAEKLCSIWKPRKVLDPFCGPCASLEGALMAAIRGGWSFEGVGIDIDLEYLETAAKYFETRREIVVECETRHPSTELKVGR